MDNTYLTKRNFTVKKETLEWLAIITVFLFSLINVVTLLISFIAMLLLLKQKEVGAIKVLNLITLRTIINPAIGVGIENYQSLKWLILFGCSIYLLIAFLKLNKKEINKIKPIIIIMIAFTIYNIIVAFIFSSLPTIAIFKLISYVFIFLGVLVGVVATYKYMNWIKWMYTLLQILMISSLFTLAVPSISYIRNGYSFQGITNQPNMFGIISVLFIAAFLTYVQLNKISKINFLVVVISIYSLVLLSQSRTSLISITLILIVFWLFQKISNLKIVLVSSLSLLLLYLYTTENSVKNFFEDYLYKGNENNILASRTEQMTTIFGNFLQNPWFGNGFAVPKLPYKSYEFSNEFVIEPGNLIISVLSYSGIFGFFLFLIFLLKVFVSSNDIKNSLLLLLSTILVSMGEMIFFSSNNMAIWCYMFIAIYIAGTRKIPESA